jgi:CheY-like chemotaxis protein/nitrogen-specific signal transduction histidine kinase
VEWDKKGNATRMIGVRQDITAIKKLHNELLEAKEKAEESDRLKTAFLQNMSHEIRTPLNGIIGFSELLKDDTLTKEEQEEFTKIIQLSGKRLIEIVNNVLDISKIDTGQMNVVNKTFALNSIMHDLHDFFYSQAEMKSLRLTHSTGMTDEESFIVSDSTKLEQILTNLLNNAIKFTDYGEVYFDYKIQGNELIFCVRDSGIGIAQEHFEHIFDRFYQTDLSISRHFEGAGLGLSICKGLVELMGGKIWLESEVGKGTSFYFSLPYVPEKTEQIATDKVNIKSSKDRKVALIAEDDETSFILLRTIMTDNGYEVIHAKNGMEAVEFAHSRDDIDVILMDIRMPVMDGMEATRKIKSFRPDIPIIGQTAYAFSNEREEIIKSGCDFYITKPIDLYELMSILNRVFGG